MKKVFLALVVFVAAIVSLNAQNTNSNASSTNAVLNVEGEGKVEWKTTSMDFGQIPFGVPKKAEFEVKNVGKKPIIITKVAAQCGCTKVEWPKEPILPGKTAFVSTEYNAASMTKFTKTVTVYFSEENMTQVLSFHGEVVEKK